MKGKEKNTLNDIIIIFRPKFVLTKLVDILNLSPYRGLTLKMVSWLPFNDSNFLATCLLVCVFVSFSTDAVPEIGLSLLCLHLGIL